MIVWLTSAAFAATAFVGATVHPVSGDPIPDGVLVVEGLDILAVGARSAVSIPADATVVDVAGHHIIPGLVDTHSHIGGSRLNDSLSQLQPGISAIDAFDPSHPSVARALAGGITTVNVMPGSGKLMGGQTAYLKLRDVATVDEMLLCHGEEGDGPMRRTQICGGMKMANGTNPQGDGGDPRTRMGSAFLQRQALLGAVERMEQIEAAAAPPQRRQAPPAPPEPDIAADALVQILQGERTIHFHTHRADDIITILRLREEFGLDVVLQHVSEAWKVVDEIAAAGVPCSLIVIDSPGGKEEALEITAANGALLEAAGVLVAFHTDDPINDSRIFLRSAALSVRAGMTPQGALAALTHNPAVMMGLEDQVGTLEPGKRADFVLLDGPPLSVWSHVMQTWVEGQLRFDRSNPADLLLATGGEATIGMEVVP